MRKALIEELDRIVPLLPDDPPNEVIERMGERSDFQRGVLEYHKDSYREPLTGLKKSAVLCKCSECGAEYFMSYISGGCCSHGASEYGFMTDDGKALKTGDDTNCSECGAPVVCMRSAAIGSWRSIACRSVAVVFNVRGSLIVLGWDISKVYTCRGEIRWRAVKCEGVGYVCGQAVSFSGQTKNYYNYVERERWTYRKKYENRMWVFGSDAVFILSLSVVPSSNAAKSGIEDYIANCDVESGCRPGQYLEVWAKYPNVENLARQGFCRILNEVLDDSVRYSGWYVQKSMFCAEDVAAHLNLATEAKPHRMLGLEKQELSLARTMNYRMLGYYKHFKEKHGIRFDEQELAMLDEQYGLGYIEEFFKKTYYGFKPPLQQTITYLGKQYNRFRAKRELTLLKDYWDMYAQYYGAFDPRNAYPRDLKAAHDRLVKAVKYKEDEAINLGITARLSELNQYSYEDEERGLMIFPAHSQSELIEEGKILDHCVGGYAKSYSEGETNIFFIRRSEEPDKPYFTLEYKNGAINQNRGYDNQDPPLEVVGFASEWLEHIKTINRSNAVAI